MVLIVFERTLKGIAVSQNIYCVSIKIAMGKASTIFTTIREEGYALSMR